MIIPATNVTEYLAGVPEERQAAFNQLRQTIIDNLPKGFEETLQYRMPSFVVPHSLYPDGYHCKPTDALPFVSIANQKNYIALYHSGIYADQDLYDWFVGEYPKYCKRKLDMGKSCIRFKKPNEIPFELIAELLQKMTPQDWIELYEKNIKKK